MLEQIQQVEEEKSNRERINKNQKDRRASIRSGIDKLKWVDRLALREQIKAQKA